MNETALKVKIAKSLGTVKGIWFYKTFGGAGTRAGVADLLVCYYGTFLALEAKVDGNTTTELQDREIAKVRGAGGVSEVVRSVDDVLRLLGTIHPIERYTVIRE